MCDKSQISDLLKIAQLEAENISLKQEIVQLKIRLSKSQSDDDFQEDFDTDVSLDDLRRE